MRKALEVGMLQFNSVFSNQHYLPLAVGMLVAYSKRHAKASDKINFRTPICDFGDPLEIARRLSGCDVLAASMYVWNEKNTLAVCELYKQLNPNGVVILGGPSIPNGQKQFRRKKTKELTELEKSAERYRFTEDYHLRYKYIDFFIHGEGERAFANLLDSIVYEDETWKRLESVSYVRDGYFVFNPLQLRMTDEELSTCPSPFLNGYFDRLIKDHPGRNWIVMYETDRGCPYQCTYCDWGGATEDKVSKFPLTQIYDDIMWMGKNKIPYVFLCNANFGILRRDIEIAKYFVECKKRYGTLEGVSTQNAKNPKPHTIDALRILDSAGLNKATVMSQQSLNQNTLVAVRRDNMDLNEYDKIQRNLARDGIYTMTDIIFPMPLETYDSLTDSVSRLIERGQLNRIQFNNLSILINTEMGNPEYQKKYGLTTVSSKMINVHGSRSSDIKILDEFQTLVVGTNTMPPELWIRARVYCWVVNFVFFNKLLQIPLILLNKMYGVSYSQLFELIVCVDQRRYPCLGEIVAGFWQKARAIRRGEEEEYTYSETYLKIYWPPEEMAHIELCASGGLQTFFSEIFELLKEKLELSEWTIIQEAIYLSQTLVRLPFECEDLTIQLNHNITEYIEAHKLGNMISLKAGEFVVVVRRSGTGLDDWESWCRNVVWYGNRRGEYLYKFNTREVESQDN